MIYARFEKNTQFKKLLIFATIRVTVLETLGCDVMYESFWELLQITISHYQPELIESLSLKTNPHAKCKCKYK